MNLKHYTSHNTAVIDEGATIGVDSKIWHFTHISSGAKIGSNCTLGQNVFVGKDSDIGNNCKIQNNVSIYDKVILEDDVFCGPSVVFTNVHNPRSFIIRKNEYRSTLVKRGASLGANSTIICGVEVGEYAFIGAGSVVTKNVKPFALTYGNPSKHIGWFSKSGYRIDLPIFSASPIEYNCDKTGEKYLLTGSDLSEVINV